MAVGDDGTIVCKGDGCSGSQTSGTTKHLREVARTGINRTNGSPLMLAVGDGGACVRLVGDEGTVLQTTQPPGFRRQVAGACSSRAGEAICEFT